MSIYDIRGHYDNFVLFLKGYHPSVFDIRVKISNYTNPDKKTIKEHLKSNTWYTYSGTVEYWVCDKYPTIESVIRGARNGAFPFIFNPNTSMYHDEDWGRRVKRTANATIRIQPYKTDPVVYNLIFDNVGVGIELRNY